jgi:hypothetical protein
MADAAHVAASGDFPEVGEVQILLPKLDLHVGTKAQKKGAINKDINCSQPPSGRFLLTPPPVL